jgi:hypothetical protein
MDGLCHLETGFVLQGPACRQQRIASSSQNAPSALAAAMKRKQERAAAQAAESETKTQAAWKSVRICTES